MRACNRGMRGQLVSVLAFVLIASPALAAGARLFKSGPIQTTADGRHVWVVNQESDSVSRIATDGGAVAEFVLPGDATRHFPRGLSVMEDGSEVLVACHDSDRVYVLSGADGSVVARIDLPWGSGPYSVAIAPAQDVALVTLFRRGAVAVVDVRTRRLANLLAPVYTSPLGVAWTEDGTTAWVTHLFAEEEHPFLTRIARAGGELEVTSKITAFATDPRHSTSLPAPYDIAEGGYLTFRGHLAQIPSATGRQEMWLPTQYGNITEDRYSPDSTLQASLRHIDLPSRRLLDTNRDKVILSAVHVHDPESQNYVGPGWNARIAGPVDLAFSQDGAMTYLLNELSGDLVVLPSNTPAVRPAGAAPLPEIRVGERPLGLAVSPAGERAYVVNSLSRDVSVIDLVKLEEIERIPVTPVSGEPLPAGVLAGAKIFHSSADPRISGNEKVACGSCHPGAEHDGRFWGFHRLPGPHGNRATMSLLGLSLTMGPKDPATGWGQLHRSGDRDEIQDFEHNFFNPQMGGTGFLGAAAAPELGPPNAGRSPELDALAEYLLHLPPVPRSPHRAPDGSLTEAAVRGATFFLGADRAQRPADAGCAACHVPETGFADLKFHDVGDRIFSSNEEELDARSPAWHVNTPTLVGVFATAPYAGVSSFAGSFSILGLIEDQARRARSSTPHGRPDGLTGRQRMDLAAFVLSIDGDMTAEEVRGARDTSPPRLVRVEPASLTAVDAWFNETVRRESVEDLGSWRLVREGGGEVPITAAVWDPQNGDRVRLSASLGPNARYTLEARETIRDAADSASGGALNALDPSDPSNARGFELGAELTITLGGSGYENITVPVHDAGMVGPGLASWGHDSVWLFPVSGGRVSTGFVRFDWAQRFTQATGVSDPEAILSARFSIEPERGDAQAVEIRRVLKRWSDPASGGDWNQNPTGGPTWQSHAHPSGRWNQAGALALGGTGESAAEYDGRFDLASRVDATVQMAAINERTVFSGDRVAEAFRFWLAHPEVDYGYALRVAPSGTALRFERSEAERGRHGPVLEITYRLPEPEPKAAFLRGDCNGDGEMEALSDALYLLQFSFLGGPEPPCFAACDVNGDGAIAGTVTDAVYLLSFAFLGGGNPPPVAPFPECGPPALETDERLGCLEPPPECG